MMDMNNLVFTVSVWVIPVLIAVTFHEAAHGFVAWRLGDDTAYRLGRVTFNPLRHIDLFGTIVLPALLLLGAKDEIVPEAAVRRVFGRLTGPRRVIEYAEGWHLLFRDLQAERVWRDVAGWSLAVPRDGGCAVPLS